MRKKRFINYTLSAQIFPSLFCKIINKLSIHFLIVLSKSANPPAHPGNRAGISEKTELGLKCMRPDLNLRTKEVAASNVCIPSDLFSRIRLYFMGKIR